MQKHHPSNQLRRRKEPAVKIFWPGNRICLREYLSFCPKEPLEELKESVGSVPLHLDQRIHGLTQGQRRTDPQWSSFQPVLATRRGPDLTERLAGSSKGSQGFSAPGERLGKDVAAKRATRHRVKGSRGGKKPSPWTVEKAEPAVTLPSLPSKQHRQR